LPTVVADKADCRLPEIARVCVAALGDQLGALKAQILKFDRCIIAWHRSNATSRQLDELPGVGPALATALVASVADPKAFRSGRDFSAWIGLVPRQNSSGGKDKLGSISEQGDRYLRSLFTTGALAVIRYAKIHGTRHRPWLTALLARRPTKVGAIALASKLARMAWAMMARYKNRPRSRPMPMTLSSRARSGSMGRRHRTRTSHDYIARCASPCSSQKRMSISRYIVMAVVSCSCAASVLLVR
jgi:transposase